MKDSSKKWVLRGADFKKAYSWGAFMQFCYSCAHTINKKFQFYAIEVADLYWVVWELENLVVIFVRKKWGWETEVMPNETLTYVFALARFTWRFLSIVGLWWVGVDTRERDGEERSGEQVAGRVRGGGVGEAAARGAVPCHRLLRRYSGPGCKRCSRNCKLTM